MSRFALDSCSSGHLVESEGSKAGRGSHRVIDRLLNEVMSMKVARGTQIQKD